MVSYFLSTQAQFFLVSQQELHYNCKSVLRGMLENNPHPNPSLKKCVQMHQ